MRILVAGGAGFVGSVLIPRLLKAGHEADVIDLCWFGNFLPAEISVRQKDLFDCLEKDFAGYDQVIFLAGLSNDPMAEFRPDMNFKYNGALPAYLAYIAKNAGVKRFIYASSCSVYGNTQSICNEEEKLNCSFPYGISKRQGESGVFQLADDSFSVVSLRKGTVCGFSPRMRFDLMINAMFRTAMTAHKIVVNNASIWRPVLSIKDAASAYCAAVTAPVDVSGIFNVVSENITVIDAAKKVAKIISEKTGQEIIIEEKGIPDIRNYRACADKANKILGFVPQFGIDDIVNELYKNKDYFGDYDSDKFFNIKIFKELINGK